MKFGLLTAILENKSFEESAKLAHEVGFDCLEVACWPAGGAERRYAGTSHIDAERVLTDADYKAEIQEILQNNELSISSLGYYPNPLDADTQKREAAIAHLKNLILASRELGVGMVTTFIGRDQHKTVEENLELAKEVWPELLALAADKNVKIGIENCPMLFGPDQWPGGQNLMTSPAMWERVFDCLDSDYLGLNFDPSHFVWQQLDYVAAVHDFADKLFHIHFKDIKLLPEALKRVGVMAYPLEYMKPKIPGLGQVDWGAFISALTDEGYEGPAVLEVEDKSFESSDERVRASIEQAYRYLLPFVS